MSANMYVNIIYNCAAVQYHIKRFTFNVLEYHFYSVKNALCDSDTSDIDIVDEEPHDGMVF